MLKIKCKSHYASRFKDKPLSFAAGFEGEVTEDIAEFLGRDAPENFTFPKGFGSRKALDAPPADKQIAEPLEKKSVGELKAMLKEKKLPVGGRKKALIKRLREAE